MRNLLLVLAASGLPAVLSACEIAPNYVETSDIDDAMARSRFKTVCKGLEMKDEDTRRYATTRLLDITEPIAQECVCQFVGKGKDGWDPAIADGMKGTQRDELASCFAELVAKPDLGNRTEAVVALAQIPAPSARKTLAAVAGEAGADPETRGRAIHGIAGDVAHAELLTRILLSDTDATARAAAAEALGGLKDQAVIDALVKAYQEDQEGEVRAAALVSLKKAGVPEADQMLCKAMMEDPSAEVRRRAVGSFRGTKRPEAIACLRKRAFAVEEDGAVREQLLQVLKSSPSQEAADVLCDAIPFFMKSYVKEELPEKIPGTDIAKYQNDRDWDRSYACLQKAYAARGGYSCFAQMYIGHWFREVGGNSYIPRCPGYEQ